MKAWILTLCLLLVAAGAVYVVWTVVLSSSGPGSPYDIPKGRYDCFMITSGLVMTDHFPPPNMTSGPMPMPPKAEYEDSIELMGRTFTIGVYGREASFSRMTVQGAFRRLRKIAEMADPSIEDSEISRINRDAADRPVKLSDDMLHLLQRAIEIADKSRGAFDLTAGPLRDAWRRAAGERRTPSQDEIRDALALRGMQHIQIDESRKVIRIRKKGVTLDLRDVIVGFALDQAAYQLLNDTVTSGWVRCGDCWRLLNHPQAEQERSWIMGIPDPNPDHVGRASRTFTVASGAVVSKGNYQGYRFINNMPVSDLVDPRSGNSVGGVAVCTLMGPDAMSCDAMASTLTVLGGGQASWFLNQFNPKDTSPKVVKPKVEGE